MSFLKLKCIFFVEPMESKTYLDDHILLYYIKFIDMNPTWYLILPWWVTLWSVFELLSH